MTVNSQDSRILVVDDEAVVRTGIARVLGGQGLEVKLAADGNEALELMAMQPANVVLLDIKMPGIDGIEVLKRIRASYPDTVVIMITGYPTSTVPSSVSNLVPWIIW